MRRIFTDTWNEVLSGVVRRRGSRRCPPARGRQASGSGADETLRRSVLELAEIHPGELTQLRTLAAAAGELLHHRLDLLELLEQGVHLGRARPAPLRDPQPP